MTTTPTLRTAQPHKFYPVRLGDTLSGKPVEMPRFLPVRLVMGPVRVSHLSVTNCLVEHDGLFCWVHHCELGLPEPKRLDPIPASPPPLVALPPVRRYKIIRGTAPVPAAPFTLVEWLDEFFIQAWVQNGRDFEWLPVAVCSSLNEAKGVLIDFERTAPDAEFDGYGGHQFIFRLYHPATD